MGVLETQGLVGFLLCIMILNQLGFYKRCIEEKRILTKFLMDCLEREVNHEHTKELAGVMGVEMPVMPSDRSKEPIITRSG